MTQVRMKVRELRKAPKHWPCPVCGTPGRRFGFRWRRGVDAHLGCRAVVKVRVGIYQPRCGCRKYFQSFHEALPPRWRFSRRVHDLVIQGVVRDKLTVEDVRRRMREDFFVRVSEGTVHNWLMQAGGKNRPEA